MAGGAFELRSPCCSVDWAPAFQPLNRQRVDWVPSFCSARLVIVVSSRPSFASLKFQFSVASATAREGRGATRLGEGRRIGQRRCWNDRARLRFEAEGGGSPPRATFSASRACRSAKAFMMRRRRRSLGLGLAELWLGPPSPPLTQGRVRKPPGEHLRPCDGTFAS